MTKAASLNSSSPSAASQHVSSRQQSVEANVLNVPLVKTPPKPADVVRFGTGEDNNTSSNTDTGSHGSDPGCDKGNLKDDESRDENAAEAYHGPGKTRPFDVELMATAQQPPVYG